MIYLIIALAAALAGAGLLGWRLYRATRALHDAEAKCRALQRERGQRENLQTMLDNRNAEARRLRSRVKKLEAEKEAMEQQASELNLNLFHESGLRILLEKEDGARRMKIDLMERQLDDANRQLRQARDDIARLNASVADQQQTIDRLSAPQPRRSARRGRENLPNQVTIDEIIESQ